MHQRIEQLLKRRDLTKLTSGRSYRLKTEVPLYSPDVPFHGICDAVLELEDGTYIPLEIKSGNASPHTGEIIQLCAYSSTPLEEFDAKIVGSHMRMKRTHDGLD